MNELLQTHGCSNVFAIPEGLRELMSDISREVLREQPKNMYEFIASYLSALLVTREHGILSVKIMNDLCDCRATISEHLIGLNFEREESERMAYVIKQEIEAFEPEEGEVLRESELLQKLLTVVSLNEEMSVKVCQVVRNAYRDYWYRKKMLEKKLKLKPDEPWEVAVENTLNIYKTTKPTFADLAIATQKIQAAYRGYYVRKFMTKYIRHGPNIDTTGPPPDIAESREIDLGPPIDIEPKRDNTNRLFGLHDASRKKTIVQTVKCSCIGLNHKSPCSLSVVQPEFRQRADTHHVTIEASPFTAQKTISLYNVETAKDTPCNTPRKAGSCPIFGSIKKIQYNCPPFATHEYLQTKREFASPSPRSNTVTASEPSQEVIVPKIEKKDRRIQFSVPEDLHSDDDFDAGVDAIFHEVPEDLQHAAGDNDNIDADADNISLINSMISSNIDSFHLSDSDVDDNADLASNDDNDVDDL